MNKPNPMENKKVVFIEDSNDEINADGVRGHLKAVGNITYKPNDYDKNIKRIIDAGLSFAGLVLLSPVYLGFAIAIKIDDPGPVLFTQKRIGKNKKYFELHKFRSMKMSTPHDTPTHMLDNPDQYITNVGKFMRKHSIDELPQIYDIFVGNMSIIGPRPALWNQDVLTAERDKYGATFVDKGFNSTWTFYNKGKDKRRLVICRDSFCTAMKNFIGAEFNYTNMIHFGEFQKSVIDDEMPDVFVYEVVERNTNQLFDFVLSD